MIETSDEEKGKITSGILLPPAKTNFGKRFITLKGLVIWRGLSEILRDKNTIK